MVSIALPLSCCSIIFIFFYESTAFLFSQHFYIFTFPPWACLVGGKKKIQWSRMYVIRISRLPSPVQLKIDQNNCRMWNTSPMWVINDATRRRRQIKSRQTQHITRRRLFTSKLDLNLRAKLVKCYIWSVGRIDWCWNLDISKVHPKYLESSETWWGWRKETISWTDRVRNEEVLHRVKEDRNILNTVIGRLTGLVTSCVGTAF